jgi:hypothetical protein
VEKCGLDASVSGWRPGGGGTLVKAEMNFCISFLD